MKLTENNTLVDDDGKLVHGRWEIDKKHQIRYRYRDGKEYAFFEGKILDLTAAGLSVVLEPTLEEQRIESKIVRLKGYWIADSRNRLNLEVKRNKGLTDTLAFQGAWTVDDNHQISYAYVEETLKTKKKILRTLAFDGYWDLEGPSRLIYHFEADSNSCFRFKGAFQTDLILAKKGEIRYQIGVEVEQKVKTQTVTLFGKWKYSDKFGLHFEIEYKNGQKHAILFGGDCQITKDLGLEINLKSREGKRLGIELLLTKDFMNKDGQAFLRLLKDPEESRIEAGLRFGW